MTGQSSRKKLLPFVVILLTGLCLFGCGHLISSEIRNSREYKLGMETFRALPEARELLGGDLNASKGDPVAKSYTVGGNGTAEITVPVSGSSRKGTLYIKATENAGQWHIDELAVRLDGQSDWKQIFPPVPRHRY